MSTNAAIPQNKPTLTIYGPPEGRDYAAAGTEAIDVVSGTHWVKESPLSSNTGWAALLTSSSASSFVGVENSTALRAIAIHSNNQIVELLGRVTRNDGEGGRVHFESASMAVDDGSTVWKPNNVTVGSPGRWIKHG